MKSSRKETARILVVEDEPGIVELCRIVLEGHGFEIDTALEGDQASKLITRDDAYDLCLVDIRTPVMNGKEFYQWLLAEHPQLADVVVFTTGDTVSGDMDGFLKRTGRPLLPKPFTPGELRSIVRETVGR